MSFKDVTPEKRKEIAKKGGRARWLRRATHEGELVIMGKCLPCVVLDNGDRILTQGAIFDAFDRPRRGTREQKDLTVQTPNFADANNLKPFISSHDLELLSPVTYLNLKKAESVGYHAEIIPIVCDLYLSARSAGVLTTGQIKTAETSELLVRSLSKVGITALVDEATGYQAARPHEALQKYFDQILTRELAEWTKRFPLEFYENIYKLRRWEWESGQQKYFRQVGNDTNNLIYKRLGPGVFEELKKRTPKSKAGNPSNKLHQWLNQNTGTTMLEKHISNIITIQRIAISNNSSWKSFMKMVDAALPIQETQESIVKESFS